MKNTFVISVGGSLVNPGQIDTSFIKNFKQLIEKLARTGDRFILIIGGGKPAREYQTALSGLIKASNDELDWMGIFATRFNAQLVRLAFGKLAHKTIVEDPNSKVAFKEKVLIAGGWKPGRSTDDDAVRLAKAYSATTIVNLSDVDYVYDKNPKEFPDAQKIERLTWKEFNTRFGGQWEPGRKTPFDPTAAKTAQKNKQRVIVANGTNLKNLENILKGKAYIGTTIE